MRTWYELSAQILRRIYDSRISGPPVLDVATDFPGARHFVEMWPRLRDEALWVAENLNDVPRFHELMAQQADISDNDGRDWRLLVLKA